MMNKLKQRLSVAWAQRIVDHQAPGTQVKAVDIQSLNVGTTSRIRLVVDHNNPEILPLRWFVKLPSRSWRARLITALPRLLQTEVRFYQELADKIPITCPNVLSAQHSGLSTTLVLNDVSELGATLGSPQDALTVDQARLVIEQLAGLHASFWQRQGLETATEWLASSVRRLEDKLGSFLAVPLMQQGLQRAQAAVPKNLHRPALDYARLRTKMMAYLNRGPTTLVHHDLHPGNFYWHDTQPGFLDWQLVRIGEGIGDVAYFMATALAPDVRQTHERQLLVNYQQALAAHGVVTGDTDELFARYQAHLLYPFEAMVVTLAIGGMMEQEANLELIKRTVAALQDHDAFRFLSETRQF